MLKGYTLVVGVGILTLGLLGASPLPPHPVHPEYALHIGAGVLYVAGGWFLEDFAHLRSFVGGLGALLIIGKVVIIGSRSIGLHLTFIPGIGYICLVIGVCSVLLALFIGISRSQ